MKRILLSLGAAGVLFVAGCATSSNTNNSAEQFSNLREAVLKIPPVQSMNELKKNHPIDINKSKSATLILPNNVKGAFEILDLSANANENFLITLQARCDCFGFRKTAPGITTYLVDENGSSIAEMKRVNPGTVSIEGVFPETKKYFLVVIADQAFLKQLVWRGGDPYNGYVSALGSPYGSVNIFRN